MRHVCASPRWAGLCFDWFEMISDKLVIIVVIELYTLVLVSRTLNFIQGHRNF